MALQIANPTVVAKVERLAQATGLTKTAAVEKAVDLLLAQEGTADEAAQWVRMDAILDQIKRLPKNSNPYDPLEWGEHGLPLLFKGNDFGYTDIVPAVSTPH
jgi:antitoxin VapB